MEGDVECICFPTDPKTWFYYGSAVEPGSQMEWNPDCLVHLPYVPDLNIRTLDVSGREPMSDVYALKQPHPDGYEWIQEFDSLAEAVQYQSDNGGVLVRREPLPGEPGLWWVEVKELDCGDEYRTIH